MLISNKELAQTYVISKSVSAGTPTTAIDTMLFSNKELTQTLYNFKMRGGGTPTTTITAIDDRFSLRLSASAVKTLG